jgi:hypothetical protein
VSWNGYRLRGYVWKTEDGIRHSIDEWQHSADEFMWETACGSNQTAITTGGGKKPRTFKGFVSCLRCLAKGDVDP